MIVLVALLSVFLVKVSGNSTVTTYADMTCTEGGRQLPNLVYARVDRRTKVQDINCESISLGGFNETYTFYYYDPYVPGTCDNIKKVTGTVFFNLVLNTKELGSTLGVDVLGRFSTGPYKGLLVTTALTYPTLNLQKCNTPIGMELLTGNIEVIILGGPTCNGVAVKTFCPGIHSSNQQNVSVGIPGLPTSSFPIG